MVHRHFVLRRSYYRDQGAIEGREWVRQRPHPRIRRLPAPWKEATASLGLNVGNAMRRIVMGRLDVRFQGHFRGNEPR